MTSATTLVMPVTRDIFAFTDRPNRQHGYMKAHQFVTLWDESEGDTFKADPPNAVLTWVDGDELKEAEVLITNAKVVGDGYGTAVQYRVKVEAGETPVGKIGFASFFVDNVVDGPEAVLQALARFLLLGRYASGQRRLMARQSVLTQQLQCFLFRPSSIDGLLA